MVGLVLVSHIAKLAEGALELGLLMAPELIAEAAGGTADGSPGTDYEKIAGAVERVSAKADGGVLVIADMGSSRMTAEMVLEDREGCQPEAVIADCPFVEGCVAAAVSAAAGDGLADVRRAAETALGRNCE